MELASLCGLDHVLRTVTSHTTTLELLSRTARTGRVTPHEAAVVGAPFELDLLEAISDLPDVRADVRRLESRLLVRQGSEANQYLFNHPLIEMVAYSTMLKARRNALHLKVAQMLEVRWAGSEADHAEQLAYHFTQTDQGTKAIKYLVIAGEPSSDATTLTSDALNVSSRPITTAQVKWAVPNWTSVGDQGPRVLTRRSRASSLLLV